MPANTPTDQDSVFEPGHSSFWSCLTLLGVLVSVIGFFVLTVLLGTKALADFDGRLAAIIDTWRGARFDGLMLTLTTFGGWGMIALALMMTLGLWVTGQRREAALVLFASGGSMMLNVLLKFAIDRPRPDVALIYLISGTRFASFPSGHAMGALATLGSLMVVVWRLGAPPWTHWLGWLVSGWLIAGISISRIYLGAHFPSDVLGGLLASSAWLLITVGRFGRASKMDR